MDEDALLEVTARETARSCSPAVGTLPAGGDPKALDRDTYVLAVGASAADLVEDSADINRCLLGPLLRDLGVAGAT